MDGVSRAADQAKSVMRLVGDLKSKSAKRMEMAMMEMAADKGSIARTYLDKTIEESGLSDR